jgi:hypothetical protein
MHGWLVRRGFGLEECACLDVNGTLCILFSEQSAVCNFSYLIPQVLCLACFKNSNTTNAAPHLLACCCLSYLVLLFPPLVRS